LVRDPLSLRSGSFRGYSTIVRRADRDVGGHEPVSTFTQMATTSGRGRGGGRRWSLPGTMRRDRFWTRRKGSR
jgi:hypothetical protein